ncbi:PqiC family protein [Salinisphaera sp. SWV1]|uniref:PqiC family protein n=1 Tax=Salinisphaera sp. SWV1 TaxID=3454139 RepID=UPI003F82EADB
MMLFRASLRRLFTAATLGVSLVALAGCATTQRSPSLFVLDAGASAPDTTPQPGAPTLMIAPVTTASYLDQGGIVYQTGPHKVVIANDNRWASSLSGQLTDDLYATLEQRLPGVNVVRTSSNQQGRYQLQTRVDQFLGHYDGKAHIAGRWTLVGPKGHTLDGHAFEKTVPLSGDGYPALVNSLSRGWQDIARGMVPALTDKLASAPRP